jgi:hypothetical protein
MFKFVAKDLSRHYTLEYLIIRGLLLSVPLFICWFLYLELSLMPILAELTERCFNTAVPQFRSSAVPQFRSSAVPQFRSWEPRLSINPATILVLTLKLFGLKSARKC